MHDFTHVQSENNNRFFCICTTILHLITIMSQNTRTKLVFICLVTTFVFWFTSMVTPGWFRHTMHNSDTNVTTHERMGIFYKEVCTEDQCDSLSYPDFYKKHYRRYNLQMLEVQIESVAAMNLCLISGIIMVMPIKSKSTKLFIVVIIIPVAATVKSILILNYIMYNVRFSLYAKDYGTLSFPYSILLSALGTVFAFIGYVVSIVGYNKSRDEDFQRKNTIMDHEIPLTVEELDL